MTSTNGPRVAFEPTTAALNISDLTIEHPAIAQEALRWSTGNRGPAVAAADLDGVDLTAFATQALTVGATAITAAGGAQDTHNLEQLIQDVGTRTAEATQRATDSTAKVTTEAAKSMDKATSEARKSLTESSEASKKAIGETVATARKELREELTRLFGGDDPELVNRLQPLLEEFTTKLTKRTDEHTAKMFDKATRALNPDDPASPLAKQMSAFDKRHTEFAAQSARQNEALTAKVAELTKAIEVQKAAAAATEAAANVTPIKGAAYEEAVGAVISQLAVGFGDEYIATGTTTGRIPYCKKGDGVLNISDSPAKVVVEMTRTSGQKRPWGDYLDEAERNREAASSLGLVQTPEENDGHRIRVLGGRRLVLAFDPEKDDTTLLHTVLCLLRSASLMVSNREDGGEVATARERIDEALEALQKLDKIQQTARRVRKSGDEIATGAEGLQTTLNRLLLQAQTALAGNSLSSVADTDTQTTGVA